MKRGKQWTNNGRAVAVPRSRMERKWRVGDAAAARLGREDILLKRNNRKNATTAV